MQQLTCPNCSEFIRAENINVNEMVAVCSNCHTVFPFKSPAEKDKRRKVKQPQNLTLRDAETLEMSFRTNWRLGSNQEFSGMVVGAVMMAFVSSILFGEFIVGDAPLILSVGFAMVTLALLYMTGTIVYNRTHIEMNDDSISVSRKPLEFISNSNIISLNGVEAIKCEETAISRKQGYDLPRYQVWAETVDGSRRPIVTDVTEEYAYFIAQRLEERLHYDVSRLEERDHDSYVNIQDELQSEYQTGTIQQG